MTNTEAVAVLKKEALFFKEINRHEGDEDLIAEALDMAISALEKIPKYRKKYKRWKRMALCERIISENVIKNFLQEQQPCEDVKEIISMLNILLDNAKVGCADITTIHHVPIDSFKFVIEKTIKALEQEPNIDIESDKI